MIMNNLKLLARFFFRLFWYSDTLTIRVLLAVSSIGFGMLLLHGETYARAAFEGMRVLASAWCWSVLFFIHGFGVLWRAWENIVRGKRRAVVALCINGLGFFIWFTSTVLIALSVGVVSPQIALESTVVVSSLISMLRSGFNDRYNAGLYALGFEGVEKDAE